MKKDYMKPAGAVVTLCVNENISTSISGGATDTYGINYSVDANGKRFIFDSDVPACEVGTEDQKRFVDLINSFAIPGVNPDCRFDI